MVWKGICSIKSTLIKGACYKLRNGISVKPLSDPWFSGHVPKLKDGVNGDVWSCVVDLRTIDDFE